MYRVYFRILNTFNCLNPYHQITSNIWLGNYYAAQDLNFLKKNNIDIIINCTPNIPHHFPKDFTYYRIPIHDDKTIDSNIYMIELMKKYTNIIQHHVQQNKNIFIHCNAGCQRSATILYSYIYKYGNYDSKSTIAFMKSRRPEIFRPRCNFHYAIQSFNQSIKKK